MSSFSAKTDASDRVVQVQLIQHVRPSNIEDLWSNIPSKSQQRLEMDHYLTETLEKWATEDDEMNKFVQDTSKIQALVNQIYFRSLNLGIRCKQENLSNYEFTFVPEGCLSCSRPCDHNDCATQTCHEVPFDQDVHFLVVTLTVVCRLLTLTNSDKLAMLLAKDTDDIYDNINERMLYDHLRSVTIDCVAKPKPIINTFMALLDNAQCFPKLCNLVVSTMSLTTCRRPAASLQAANVQLIPIFFRYLRTILDLLRSSCLIETWTGITSFLNIIPALYQFGGWKIGQESANFKHLITAVVVTLCHICHDYVKEFDKPPSLDKLPETLSTRPLISTLLVIDDADEAEEDENLGQEQKTQRPVSLRKDLLNKNPESFAIIAGLEVLGWWSHKGVNLEVHIPVTDGEPYDVPTAIQEYRKVIDDIIANNSNLAYIQPILESIIKREKSPKPRTSQSLLYGPLVHSFRRCGLPSCRKSAGDAGHDLLFCAACNGLEQYCSKEHQKKHWKVHKHFCKNNRISHNK
mmetsp:Transcript_14749/g.17972  ORF Transcript_14749/g.17972 Transcript_14749/m.17972 type:complete len:519 (+) Transcript_14749:163-1719(+)